MFNDEISMVEISSALREQCSFLIPSRVPFSAYDTTSQSTSVSWLEYIFTVFDALL